MALLVPDDSLLCLSIAKKFFIEANATFFIRDKCCHLTLCLHLMEPNCFESSALHRLLVFWVAEVRFEPKTSRSLYPIRNVCLNLIISCLVFASGECPEVGRGEGPLGRGPRSERCRLRRRTHRDAQQRSAGTWIRSAAAQPKSLLPDTAWLVPG